MLRRKTLVWPATRRVLLLAWHLVCKCQIVQLIIARFLIGLPRRHNRVLIAEHRRLVTPGVE